MVSFPTGMPICVMHVRDAPLPTHAGLLADVSSVNGEPTAGLLAESRTAI